MSTISKLISNLSSVKLENVLQEEIADKSEELLDAQRNQLLEGKLSTGLDITPSYLDDPFFKSRESAQRYSNWKDKITPNPKRKKGTPNLYIIGTLHSSISVALTAKSAVFDLAFKKPDIISKFTENILGLNEEKAAEYSQNHIAPGATKRIKQKILS